MGDVSDVPDGAPSPHTATERLDDLAGEAAGIDEVYETGPPQQPPPDPKQLEHARNVQTIVASLKMARSLAAPKFTWWPAFGFVWGDDTLNQQGEALEAFREHMGWEVSALMDEWGPYIALLMAFGLPAYATYEAIQDHKRELMRQRAEQAEKARAEQGASGQ